jgi:uncharacterized protein YecT (DUF1311 family)
MKLKIALALGGLLLAAAGSQATAAGRPHAAKSCLDTATTQGELDGCAASLARAADAKLNRSYRQVMCHLGDEDSREEKAQLLASQRAWIAFRDADCAWQSSGGGTIAPMNHSLCVASLSNDRAKELDAWPFNAPRDAIAPCDSK